MRSVAYKGRSHAPPSIMTAHTVESLNHVRRAKETRIYDLLQYGGESQRLTIAAKKEEQVLNTRKEKLAVRENADKIRNQMRKEIEERKKDEALIEDETKRIEQEKEQKKVYQESIEREVQRICETSDELKELERKLKIAYINKARASQYQESLMINQIENAREQMIEDKMETDRQEVVQKEIEKDRSQREKLISQKLSLQKQMHGNELLLEKAKQEAINDKEMVDKILAKINDEDKLESRERNEKKNDIRAHIKEYQENTKREQIILLQKEKEQEDESAAYNELMLQRQKKEETLKKQAEEDTKIRWNEVVKNTELQKKSSDESNSLREVIWEEELEDRKRKEEEEKKCYRLKLKDETMVQNLEQIQAKKQQWLKLEEEEKELVSKMLEKFGLDDEDERIKQRHVNIAKMKFVAEAKQQRDEKAQIFHQERQRECQKKHSIIEQDDFREKIIADARKQLLAQHANQIKGYLPKGTIMNKEEAQIFDHSNIP